MTISLHEIEPGVWIVPELVDRVRVHVDVMTYTYHVTVGMIFGGEVNCRPGQARVENVPEPSDPTNAARYVMHVLDDVDAMAQAAAAEVVAWIDARRTEPLKIVQS